MGEIDRFLLVLSRQGDGVETFGKFRLVPGGTGKCQQRHQSREDFGEVFVHGDAGIGGNIRCPRIRYR